MHCKNCGNEIDPNAGICVKCGVEKGKGDRFCHNCGTPLQNGAAICTGCGVEARSSSSGKTANLSEKLKRLIKKRRFWIGVAVAFVVFIIILAASGDGTPSDLIELPEAEYRQQCQTYSYDSIARNPDQYEKKLAKFTGEVVQIMKSGDELQMRVDVTFDGYIYTDTMFVFYNAEGGTNVLEGDIINMYGELRGMQEYETVLGVQMSIPRIYVQYIDIIG